MPKLKTEAQQNHHAECWRDPRHHACAVRHAEELLIALDATNFMLNESHHECICADGDSHEEDCSYCAQLAKNDRILS